MGAPEDSSDLRGEVDQRRVDFRFIALHVHDDCRPARVRAICAASASLEVPFGCDVEVMTQSHSNVSRGGR